MNILAAVLMVFQLLNVAVSGYQQLKPALVSQSAQTPAPQPIAQQPGDQVRYWWDAQRQQWCCEKNGVLFVWAPPR